MEVLDEDGNMFANSWSPRTEKRRACWIWKAEGVATGRNRTLSYDTTIASPASHAHAVSGGGRHEDRRSGWGHAPFSGPCGEYGLMRRQSQLCLDYWYTLEGVWDEEENLYLGEQMGREIW